MLTLHWKEELGDHTGRQKRTWAVYACSTCGACVLAEGATDIGDLLVNVWPETSNSSPSIPSRAREYLDQALASKHAPAGAVMLAASSVDAMLKEKGLKSGSLYSRIEEAKNQHMITPEMAEWAHEVRLDANDQRHADEGALLPTPNDATRILQFAQALAQFLFVLPALVKSGRSGTP